MADFSTPFGKNAGRRLPTSDERSNGFPCGAADQTLFNGLFHRLESEIGEVISFAGLTPSDSTFIQLRQAIEALISAATGGGDTSQFLLVSQAASRLPIFPQVDSADGRMNVTSPASGTVRIPGNVDWLHRGINPMTTVETDFATQPSRTYHIRWNPDDGYTLEDLSDAVNYNPSTLDENNVAFDTTYDDMLIARVVTNSSNVATITNLANLQDLNVSKNITGTDVYLSGLNGANFLIQDTLNWSRTPSNKSLHLTHVEFNQYTDNDVNYMQTGVNRSNANNSAFTQIYCDRYVLDNVVMVDGSSAVKCNWDARA